MTPEAMRELAAQTCESGAGDTLSNDDCCRANAQAIRAIPIPPAAAQEHVDSKWCADLRCRKCYGADTWKKSQIANLERDFAAVRELLAVSDGALDAANRTIEWQIKELAAANARADEAERAIEGYDDLAGDVDNLRIDLKAAEQSLAAERQRVAELSAVGCLDCGRKIGESHMDFCGMKNFGDGMCVLQRQTGDVVAQLHFYKLQNKAFKQSDEANFKRYIKLADKLNETEAELAALKGKMG